MTASASSSSVKVLASNNEHVSMMLTIADIWAKGSPEWPITCAPGGARWGGVGWGARNKSDSDGKKGGKKGN